MPFNLYIMNTFTIDNHQLTYAINYYKKRKSIQLKLENPQHLLITAPSGIPKDIIENIISQKSRWIIKQITRLTLLLANPVNKRICHDSTILFLGQPHILKFNYQDITTPAVYLQDRQIVVNLPPPEHQDNEPLLRALIRQWYIRCATETLTAKTVFWASAMKVTPRKITIKEQKTRWGSCSSKGNINYNWRIIMAPPEVIDYLVIHELCHLCIPNHSQAFWHTVEKYCVHYNKRRSWLRTNGALLMPDLSSL